MDARFNYYGNPVGLKFQKRLNALGGAVTDSNLPAETQFLCMIRASQINGCGVCTDMHTKDAAHAGETSVRLNLIAAWRDAKVFTDAERAALELTEQGTRLADAPGGVTDEVLGQRRQALRRRPARRPGIPHSADQRLQPPQRHHQAARRRLPARPVVIAAVAPARPSRAACGWRRTRGTLVRRIFSA